MYSGCRETYIDEGMNDLVQISDAFIEANTHFPSLIAELQSAFAQKDILVPLRHHHDFPNPAVGADSTLLLMPAWKPSAYAGVKMVTVSPENGRFDMPSIHGTYMYMDATNGTVKALLEAKNLTAKRTAAASALAASYLSPTDCHSMLMVGTGALSKNLIEAHASVRPIKRVYIWGRNLQKAQQLAASIQSNQYQVMAVDSIQHTMPKVQLISCATLSKRALVLGDWLQAGQHLDLVGAYKPDMRETDNQAMAKAHIYVDTFQGGCKESGDIVIPLQEGIIKEQDILGDLFALSAANSYARRSEADITIFKSVGHALEDLAAAHHYYQLYTKE